MKRIGIMGTLIWILWLTLVPDHPVFGDNNWLKKLQRTLQSTLHQSLFERYIRLDSGKNQLAISPAVVKLAVAGLKSVSGGFLRAFDLEPAGSALNLSWQMESGTRIRARFEPQALELGREEAAVDIRLPQGLEFEGAGLAAVVLSYLVGPSGLATASTPSIPDPPNSAFLAIPEVLRRASGIGNSIRLRCSLKDSALGRALASVVAKTAGTPSFAVWHRLPLSMVDGWLQVDLSKPIAAGVFPPLTMDNLLNLLPNR